MSAIQGAPPAPQYTRSRCHGALSSMLSKSDLGDGSGTDLGTEASLAGSARELSRVIPGLHRPSRGDPTHPPSVVGYVDDDTDFDLRARQVPAWALDPSRFARGAAYQLRDCFLGASSQPARCQQQCCELSLLRGGAVTTADSLPARKGQAVMTQRPESEPVWFPGPQNKVHLGVPGEKKADCGMVSNADQPSVLFKAKTAVSCYWCKRLDAGQGRRS